MLNRVVLMGRLTRDPELRYTPQNVPVCTITLAVERSYTPQGAQRETDFIDVVAWRQTAEFVSKYFRKGLLVAVEGRLQSRKWKDKFEQNRVSFEVVADNVYFAERANDAQRSSDFGAQPYGGGQSYGGQSYGGAPAAPRYNNAPAAPQYSRPEPSELPPVSDFTEIDDDDVPF